MKQLLVILCGFSTALATAQEPVTWRFAIESSGGHYLLTCNAQLKPGWHLYSQTQPKGAIAVPTSFRFNKNPLLSLACNILERGNLEKHRDEVLETEAYQYIGVVAFQQKIWKKTKAKTVLSGSVTYQLCTDEKCLPPKRFPFFVVIE